MDDDDIYFIYRRHSCQQMMGDNAKMDDLG